MQKVSDFAVASTHSALYWFELLTSFLSAVAYLSFVKFSSSDTDVDSFRRCTMVAENDNILTNLFHKILPITADLLHGNVCIFWYYPPIFASQIMCNFNSKYIAFCDVPYIKYEHTHVNNIYIYNMYLSNTWHLCSLVTHFWFYCI